MIAPDRRSGLSGRWLALVLVALGVLAYWPLQHAGWIWDDNSYVTENPVLVDAEGLAKIWTPGGTPQFYPMVFMTFWCEARLYGDDFVARPFGFHLVNWALHLGSAFLLWRILTRLAVPGAWLAAAIFLVHPMQVESVAWVTERKNVLAVVLALASLRAWLAFGEAKEGERAGWYLTSLLLFALAMLSKTMVAVLAPTLIALHVWQRRKWSGRDLLAIAPFFAIGVPLGLVTAWLERDLVGASGTDFSLTLLDRVVLAPRSALWYVWTWLWPSNIAFNYERWDVSARMPAQWIPLAVVLAAAASFVILWRRGWRGPMVLAAIFVGAVFPALGFLNVYPFLFSYVADHFAYVGTIALAVSSGYVLARTAARVPRAAAIGGAALLLLTLSGLSAMQVTAYEDEEALWRRTLATNPRAWMPASNLAGKLLAKASVYGSRGHVDEAASAVIEAEHWARQATELRPAEFTPWMKLSEAHRLQGRLDEALSAVREAKRRNATMPDIHWMEGRLLQLLGRRDEAVEPMRLGATLPDLLRADLVRITSVRTRRADFARLLAELGRDKEAALAWGQVSAVDPHDPMAYADAGLARERTGEFQLAADAFKSAIAQADPGRRPGDDQLVLRIMPKLINALLSAPRSNDDRTDALDAALWLVGRVGREDPLALLFLARAEKANGIATADATFAEAAKRSADPLLPQALRDEINRFAPAFVTPDSGR
ncbi:MAG: glycosyltransferase family 39 protein [Phycisphaerae bacterium]|nr:glycosyltransferase family 39 protein [Phycisphaerae bacterium]